MSFSSKKLLPATNKKILVRIEPGQNVIDSLSVVSGNLYNATLELSNVSKVEVNGTSYTEVIGTPSANEFSYNETTKEFQIDLNASKSTFDAVMVFFYIFITNDKGIVTYEDPQDSNTTERLWEPRIQGSLNYVMNQKDILDGVFEIGNTAISVINTDNFFAQYDKSNISFHRKGFICWHYLDDISNISKFYKGVISSLSISKIINISVDSQFNNLKDNFYSNTTLAKSIFDENTYPNIELGKINTPIQKFFSVVSWGIDNKFGGQPLLPVPITGSNQLNFILADGPRLTNISFDATVGTSNNRTWAACIASTASSELSESAANVSTVVANRVYRTDVADARKYRCGDNLEINSSNGFHVERFDTANNTIDIRNYSGSWTLSNGDTILRRAIPFVQLNDPENNEAAILRYGRDYTLTTNVDNVYVVNLVNNFEANFSGSASFNGGISPSSVFYYRVYNNDSLDHGDIIQEILENAGLDVDTSSITTANATTIKTSFAIPFKGSSEFPSYLEVLQRLLRSTFGYLFIKNDFTIGYSLFGALSPSDTVKENDFIKSTLNYEIDYKDIFTRIDPHNDHGEIVPTDNYDTLDERNTVNFDSVSYNDKIYLHGVNRVYRFEVAIEDVANSINRIGQVLSERRLTMNYISKGRDFETIIGDEITIESALFNSGSKNFIVLGVVRDTKQTQVVAIDLQGIS